MVLAFHGSRKYQRLLRRKEGLDVLDWRKDLFWVTENRECLLRWRYPIAMLALVIRAEHR